MRTLFLAFLLVGVAAGQAIKLSGGQSTLTNSEGGGANVYFNGQTIYLGGGRGIGFSDKFKLDGFDVIAGDSIFAYSVEGAGTSLFERGIKVEKKTNNQTFGAFVGLVGLSYTVPYFSSMNSAKYPGIGFYYNRKTGKWTFNSLEVFSRQKTLIQSARYDGKNLSFYANAGIIQNTWQAGGTFIFTPIKELKFTGSDIHQWNYKSDNLSAYLAAHGFQAGGGITRSTYLNKEIRGANGGAGWSHGWVQVRSDWYKSSGQHQTIVNSLTETTRHWSITEAVNNSRQFQYGGSYHNNAVQLSFNHTIAFIPSQGYQSIISVGIGFKIHDSAVSTQEYLLPHKRFKYSAYADQWIQGPIQSESSGHHMRKGIGKQILSGVVVREDGSGVEGMAVKVGKETVYTDSRGMWQCRSKRKITSPISLDLENSIAPGSWVLVSQTELKITIKQQ
jgi:hypothetical protein